MSDPHALIQDFFSAVSIPHYRKYVSSSFSAAISTHYWKREDPGSLLYFQKKMDDLMDAAKLLAGGKPKALLSPEVLEQDTIDPALYLDKRLGNRQWEAFPRTLSKNEFLNPYLVFDRFFRYRSLKQWHNDFREIIFYALSPHSCTEDLVELDLLKINRFLFKLIEAAHLVLVREISAR